MKLLNRQVNFSSAPTFDDRLLGSQAGAELGRLKKPIYSASGGLAGAVGGGVLGAVTPSLAGIGDGFDYVREGATAGTVAGGLLGSKIGGALAVPVESVRGYMKGASGLSAPIVARTNDLNTSAIPDIVDDVVDVGEELVDNTIPYIDEAATTAKNIAGKTYSAIKRNPTASGLLAGAGVAGIGAGAGTYLANKNKAEMACNYASVPAGSNKRGVYRKANFSLLDRFTNSVHIPSNIEELKNTNIITDGKTGSMIGKAIGGYAGTLAGASYNPDIIDEETGEKRKLDVLPRVAIVAGGRALGGAAGSILGGTTGGTVGLLRPKISTVSSVSEYSASFNVANFASWKGQAAASILSDNPFEVISDLKEAARLRDNVKGVIPDNLKSPAPGWIDRITGDIGTHLGAAGAATGAGLNSLGKKALGLGESMKSGGMDLVLDEEASRKLGRNVLAGTGIAAIGTGLGVNTMLNKRKTPVVVENNYEEAVGAFKSSHKKYSQFTWN